jgi:cell division protein FtsX
MSKTLGNGSESINLTCGKKGSNSMSLKMTILLPGVTSLLLMKLRSMLSSKGGNAQRTFDLKKKLAIGSEGTI